MGEGASSFLHGKMLLIGAGLVGLAGFRKELRKRFRNTQPNLCEQAVKVRPESGSALSCQNIHFVLKATEP